MWWHDGVIYQIYPRSFQDSNGDGLGDLPGIVKRLDHVKRLGADAIWLSPIYPSPNKDFGYDVSDYRSVAPEYGTLDDLAELIRTAHGKDLKLILDFVPCHTSTEHPWFRERPDFYFWADAPPNNWRATFGGSAWERDPETGRYYLHTFFPEQADLNWRNPAVRAEMTEALQFWLKNGVDGFRLDAINGLLKDPDLRDDPPATEPFPLPLHDEYARLSHVHSANVPDVGTALNSIRHATKQALLIGEAYLPTAQLGPYLEALDVVFAFETMNAGPDPNRLIQTITAAAATGKPGWVLSNHDFTRFATRFGDNFRAAAILFATLPGPLFIFQGDELGMPDGPGTNAPLDRHDRDRFRHPFPWHDSDEPNHGFTTGTPWLPTIAPPDGTAAEQERDTHSTLNLFKRLIAIKRRLPHEPAKLIQESPPDTLIVTRGDYTIAINLGDNPVAIRRPPNLVLEATAGDATDPNTLPPHGAWIAAN